MKIRVAIVVSEFNPEITDGLLWGAQAVLQEKNITVLEEDIFYAPGAFELPLFAKKLAQKKKYDGVICLGCVVKGDTMHFEFISLAATMGILQASLESKKPITFGVLTTTDEKQAKVRSRKNPENKGREAATACVESILTLRTI